jgi:RNA polymerase sigma factor (sigma-70 family)
LLAVGPGECYSIGRSGSGVNPERLPCVSRAREEQLVDEVAIRAFLGTRYPRLVTAIAVMVGSRPAAEDAVQEALARAWERSLRGQEIDNLDAWVTVVAMNLGRSGLRRLMAERRARTRSTPSEMLHESNPERIDVVRELGRLPRRQREATVLRYYLGLDVAEIAEVLGVTQGTVKTTLFRARATLAERLGEDDREEANDRED